MFRHDSQDTVIGTWQQVLKPRAVGFDAQAIDLTIDAPAFTVSAGDQLVLRYAGELGLAMSYIPNGEGSRANGRIPFVTLPR